MDAVADAPGPHDGHEGDHDVWGGYPVQVQPEAVGLHVAVDTEVHKDTELGGCHAGLTPPDPQGNHEEEGGADDVAGGLVWPWHVGH